MIIGVRHAAVEASMAGRCYGATDVGTVLSHGAAARIALASLQALDESLPTFDAVWTSDLSRCRGLAEALAPELIGSPEVHIDPRLRELNHGSFEGRAWTEIHGSEPANLERWGAHWQSEGPPEGESAEALQRRVSDWQTSIDTAQRHLLVGHAGPMRALLVAHQGLNWPAAMGAEIRHLEATRLA